MIPVLYSSTETAYTTNGLGRLKDAIICVVEEERNGMYTLTMRYPVKGQHYSDIELNCQILAKPSYGKTPEPFRIVKITKPLNGIVTIEANHISYDLKKITIGPFTASSCAGALTAMQAAAMDTLPFTFWTDKDVAASYKSVKPAAVRSLLGGESNSFLDVFGTGEYEFARRQVKLWLHRGSDKGVTIRYGKNLTDIEAVVDADEAFSAVVPFWESVDGKTVVTGSKITSGHESEFPGAATIPLNLSEAFEEEPTVAQLEARATAYLTNNTPWEIKQNLTISFVNLADTEEYKGIAALQAVNLCDTVHVTHPGLGVSVSAKVIRTEYDTLLERYDEVELGKPRTSLKQAISPITKEELSSTVTQNNNFLVENMEELVANLFGAAGGYIKFVKDLDGHISEIYAMDTDDESTAVNVLRINHLGIYCSTNGINGTYNLAITTGGTINASQVLTGVLRAIEITNGNGTFHVSSAGEMTATSGEIGGWTLTSAGFTKVIEVDGVEYRTVIRAPSASGDIWTFSCQYRNVGASSWYAKYYIAMNGDAYIQNIVNSPTMAGANITGNAAVGGRLTVTGITTHTGLVRFDGQAQFYNPAFFFSSVEARAGGNFQVYSDNFVISADTIGFFGGDMYVNGEVKTQNTGGINVTAKIDCSGAETHTGAETHSGSITNTGDVDNQATTKMKNIRLDPSATWTVAGTGGYTGNVEWHYIEDVFGNRFYIPGIVPVTSS